MSRSQHARAQDLAAKSTAQPTEKPAPQLPFLAIFVCHLSAASLSQKIVNYSRYNETYRITCDLTKKCLEMCFTLHLNVPTCQVQVYSLSKSHKMAASAIISNVLALEFAHGLLLVLVAKPLRARPRPHANNRPTSVKKGPWSRRRKLTTWTSFES